MAQYLNPKNDLTFKRVFGEHKHLCISLLNSLLPFDEAQQIVDVSYETGELVPELPNLKNTIVDVRCTDVTGRQFIVEMQMSWTDSFKQRVLLNASKAYVKQLDKAKDYVLLQPVYVLNLVCHIFDKTKGREHSYYHHYKIVNIFDTQQQIKGLEFVFIELPKFRPEGRAERKLRELWLRFLTEVDESTSAAPADLLENAEIHEALGYVERGAYTKEQLDAYDKYRDAILVESTLLNETAQKNFAKGKQEGRQAEKRDVAKNMKSLGISIAQISAATGLLHDEIERL
ncbi:MAG: Rpn family recombination-promoting nuclease/putative transposase [Prevotellaceae bacterium]|jgi:predicted transposase/invertase (TIGR01784 family)|nr:Rpn family recombination-promoting nuclease/putative transposase [Prevotellaceae bacterium]